MERGLRRVMIVIHDDFTGLLHAGGRLATRRQSSSRHPRIGVSGGCRVESDGVAQTPVSGSLRSRSSNPTIASESATIEWFRRGSRIGEIERSRQNERFELWLTTRLPSLP